jgi:hypothetical protein
MMAGSSMRYEFDRAGGKAIGAKVRLVSSILAAPLEIEQYVIECGGNLHCGRRSNPSAWGARAPCGKWDLSFPTDVVSG